MAKLIGSLKSMYGVYALPPCKWPGCRDAAETTGLLAGGMANLCAKHKMLADRQAQKRGRK